MFLLLGAVVWGQQDPDAVQSRTERTISKYDTIQMALPESLRSGPDKAVTVQLKYTNDEIRSKSLFHKNKLALEIVFYNKPGKKMFLVIANEPSPKNDKAFRSWIMSAKEGKITSCREENNDGTEITTIKEEDFAPYGYRKSLTQDFIKAYALALFEKL